MAIVVPRGFNPSALLRDRAHDRKLSLQAALDAIAEIPEPLQSRMAGGLRNEISRSVAGLDEDLLTPLTEDTIHPGDAWARLHATDWTGRALLSEALHLVSGAVVRSPDKHDWEWRSRICAFCGFADKLVDEISSRTPIGHWESFTVPGLVDQFEYESSLITIPFARPSLWTLPSTAHEFGHYAARSINRFESGTSINLLDEVHAALPGATSWYWVEELFADAFAAWTMGPAYGLSCMTFGFDPVTAYKGSSTHPPESVRIDLICRVLAAFPDDTVVWLGRQLRAAWGQLVEMGEADPALSEDCQDAPPGAWFGELVSLLGERVPYARYSTSDRATVMAAQMFIEAPSPGDSIVDIVNAAWMARVNAPSLVSVNKIHRDALVFLDHAI